MFKLALSAGHGMKTAGKRCLKKLDSNETREWYLNNRICKKIEKKLKNYAGVQVLRLDDRSGICDIPLKRRTNDANRHCADFYLSVHHNAGINGGTGGGIETYVYTDASGTEKRWQKALYNALIEKTGLRGNRAEGMRKANLHECRETDMPCVLIECGFMDSKTDVPIILTEEFAEKVAEACVEVIVAKAELKIGNTIEDNAILKWQKAAQNDGFAFVQHGADGKWGKECESVAKRAVCKQRSIYKYKNLTAIVQRAVGEEPDGKFGPKTHKAVKEYQKNNRLVCDGCVGLKTWKKILEVK